VLGVSTTEERGETIEVRPNADIANKNTAKMEEGKKL
jgi:hypothetical protein